MQLQSGSKRICSSEKWKGTPSFLPKSSGSEIFGRRRRCRSHGSGSALAPSRKHNTTTSLRCRQWKIEGEQVTPPPDSRSGGLKLHRRRHRKPNGGEGGVGNAIDHQGRTRGRSDGTGNRHSRRRSWVKTLNLVGFTRLFGGFRV
jgi:hypothetical protein